MTQICKWCEEPRPLVKSHVIAESLVVRLKDQDTPMAIAGSESSHVERNRTGIYSRIVCRSCEDKFQPFDDLLLAFSRQLSKGQVVEGEAVFYPDVDGASLAKAVLSVLYRAHLSDHKFFASVDLGPYEKELAAHLGSDRSGCPANFSVILHVLDSDSGAAVLSPFRVRMPEGVNGYRLYLPHISALIRVDRRGFPGPLPGIELSAGRPVICFYGTRWNADDLDLIRPVMDRHLPSLDRLFRAARPPGE